MTTQNRHDDVGNSNTMPYNEVENQIEPGTTLGEDRPLRHKRDWLQFGLYTIAAIAAVGLLVTVVGVYVLDNPIVMVVGALMVSGAAVAWIVGGMAVIAAWLVPRFWRRFGDAPQQTDKV